MCWGGGGVRPRSPAGLGWIERAAMRDADALDDTETEGKDEALEVEAELAAINAMEEDVGAGVDDGTGTLKGLGLGTETGVGTGAIGAVRGTEATLISFFAMFFSCNTPGINPPPLPPLLLLPGRDPAKGAGPWLSDSVIPSKTVLLSAPLAIPAGSEEELRGGGAVRTGRFGSGVTMGTGGGAEETFNMDFRKEDEEGDVTAVVALGWSSEIFAFAAATFLADISLSVKKPFAALLDDLFESI